MIVSYTTRIRVKKPPITELLFRLGGAGKCKQHVRGVACMIAPHLPAVFGQWLGTMAQVLSLYTEDRSSLRPANFNKPDGSNDSGPYQHDCNTLNHLITVAWAIHGTQTGWVWRCVHHAGVHTDVCVRYCMSEGLVWRYYTVRGWVWGQ